MDIDAIKLIQEKAKVVQDIVDLAVKGKSDTEIARKVGLSIGTTFGIRKFYFRHRYAMNNLTQDFRGLKSMSPRYKDAFIFRSIWIPELAMIEFTSYKVVNVDKTKKQITLQLR